MLIKRVSDLSGKTHFLDLPVTQEQMEEFARPGHKRRLLQDIFPDLTVSQREFIKTGITQEEWDAAFKDLDDDVQPFGDSGDSGDSDDEQKEPY